MIAAQYMGTSMLTNALQVRIDEPGVLSPACEGLLISPAPSAPAGVVRGLPCSIHYSLTHFSARMALF